MPICTPLPIPNLSPPPQNRTPKTDPSIAGAGFGARFTVLEEFVHNRIGRLRCRRKKKCGAPSSVSKTREELRIIILANPALSCAQPLPFYPPPQPLPHTPLVLSSAWRVLSRSPRHLHLQRLDPTRPLELGLEPRPTEPAAARAAARPWRRETAARTPPCMPAHRALVTVLHHAA